MLTFNPKYTESLEKSRDNKGEDGQLASSKDLLTEDADMDLAC